QRNRLVAPASAERLSALDPSLRRILRDPSSRQEQSWSIPDAADSIGIPAIDLLAVVNGCSSNACAAARSVPSTATLRRAG
ncbi:MAG: hypothetical protein IPK78_17855, partial [Rhodospirillales bacterium]|nr:hypothetical protein [Rhodospirillales bacterium]